jgi:hypothetical protein
LSGSGEAQALAHLDHGPAAYFRKALRYLRDNPGIAREFGSFQ